MGYVGMSDGWEDCKKQERHVTYAIGRLTPAGISQSLYFSTSFAAMRGRRVVAPMARRFPSNITAD